MTEHSDSKGLKTLSHILALVLDGEEGESQAALAAIRRRARKDRISGTLLKELMQKLPNARAERRAAPASHATLREMQHRLVEARLQLDREQRCNAILRERLAARRSTPANRMRMADLEQRLAQDEALRAQLTRTEIELYEARSSVPAHTAQRGTLPVWTLRLAPSLSPGPVVAGLALIFLLAADQSGLPANASPRSAQSPTIGAPWPAAPDDADQVVES